MQEYHLVQQKMPLCRDHICFMFTLNLGKEMWSQGIGLSITNLLLISSNAPLQENIQCKIAGLYGWGKGNKYDIFERYHMSVFLIGVALVIRKLSPSKGEVA